MNVGNSHGSGSSQAHERYREAMADLLRRTRARVQSARQAAVRHGQEVSENRRAESKERANVERSPQRHADQGAPERPNSGANTRDRVDISNAAMARIHEMLDHGGEEHRRERVERLRRAFHSGTLNNPERMERAAERILNARPPELANQNSDS